ncbi:LPXTG cell wall anchor domain-containing protein [Limosilactobacillus caccae]|uniref:LPXTG cell wall anchor domain-containing protein n=1 Tax=Limosilactobacillus caccae TaxID=1926284 RepID=UPI000970CC6A|nr:LPXTG cell wall anchor domain-containing protein [Limosilactobacillus caccae]
MNKMHKQALTTSAVLAGVLIGAGTTETAHADEAVSDQQQATVSPEGQYANEQSSAQQQLASLQQQNQAKENDLRQQNTQANDKDAATVQQKVTTINERVASANKADQDKVNQQVAQKQATVTAGANEQIKAENTAYQQSKQKQLSANDQAVKAQEASYSQALANAAKMIVTPAQKAAQVSAAQADQKKAEQGVTDQFNHTIASAKTAHDTAVSQATTKRDQDNQHADALKQQDLKNQQAQNAKALAAAKQAYDQAVANAPRINTAVKPATPAGGDQLTSYGKGLSQDTDTGDNGQSMHPEVSLGTWYNTASDLDLFKDKTNLVTDENQLPLDFKLGLLAYDPAQDHSEKINGDLTNEQKQRLNDLSNQWMNDMRHRVWEQMKIQNTMADAHVDGYSSLIDPMEAMTVGEMAPKSQLQDLITPKNYWNHVSTLIGTTREQHHNHYEHSMENAKDGAGYDDDGGSFYDEIRMFSGQDSAAMTWDAPIIDAAGENLYTVEGNTMLEMEVNLYNRMQSMLWGEFYSSFSKNDQAPHLGGHLANVINPHFKLVGMAFQNAKTDPDFFVENTGSDNQNETFYYITWDFAGDYEDYTTKEYEDTFAQDDEFFPEWEKGLVNTGVIAKIKSTQTPSYKPDLNAPAVKQAQAHVDQVKADGQKAVDTINAKDYHADILATYDATIKRVNDEYTKQVNAATKDRDTQLQTIKDQFAKKIADIKAQPESLAALEQQLSAKLAAVKADGQAKLNALQTAHDAKLAAINKAAADEVAAFKAQLEQAAQGANDHRQAEAKTQIAKLTADHDVFVKANNDKLAALLASDRAAYDQLKNKLDADLAALHTKLFPQQAGVAKNGQAVVSGKTNTLVLTENGMATSKGATAVLPIHRSQGTTSDGAVKQARLPQTGSSTSAAALALGAVSAMFGLGLMKKREY